MPVSETGNVNKFNPKPNRTFQSSTAINVDQVNNMPKSTEIPFAQPVNTHTPFTQTMNPPMPAAPLYPQGGPAPYIPSGNYRGVSYNGVNPSDSVRVYLSSHPKLSTMLELF